MIGAYLALTVYGVFFADSIIFQPPSPGYRDDASVLKLTSADGARISAKYFPNANATFTLLFSHGNAEDIGYDIPLLEAVHDAGFAIFAYDYQGYFTKAICNIEYVHRPELAPTADILDRYKKAKNGDWGLYERQFLDLMRSRHIESISRDLLDGGCLLCSEEKPNHCHRRLVAEYLKEHWSDVEIEHIP